MGQLITVENAKKCCEEGRRRGRPVVRLVFEALWTAYEKAHSYMEGSATTFAGLARAVGGTITGSGTAINQTITIEVPLGAAGKVAVPTGFFFNTSYNKYGPSLGEAVSMLVEAQAQARKREDEEIAKCVKERALPQTSRPGYRKGTFRSRRAKR